ncbi:hypothetical protein HBI37_041810 [Parastagonospora nodorum]|nr:hypothetical protein HBH75_071730 [Parastagonospora nodorum]KAH6351971.1 hypothetical protein HBI37_041810 [Parastagonospora nodorum]
MAVICRQLTFIPNKSGGASPNLSILGSKNTLLPHFSQNLYAAVARYDFPLGEWGREKDRLSGSNAGRGGFDDSESVMAMKTLVVLRSGLVDSGWKSLFVGLSGSTTITHYRRLSNVSGSR